MPTPGQILVAAGAAALAYLALRRKPTPVAGPPAECNPSPYNWAQQSAGVSSSINTMLDQGRRDPIGIATDVASEHFSPHPSGPAVAFPPVQNPQLGLPLPGVQCVYDNTQKAVTRIMMERGITPGDDEGQPVVFNSGGAYDPGYPWVTPTLSAANSPTPGQFWRATFGGEGAQGIDGSEELFRWALGSALAMAGNDEATISAVVNPNNADYGSANSKRLRHQMRDLILCSKWNDELYGRSGEGAPQENGPNGRRLNWLPRHADNIGLLGSGNPPKRTTTLGGGKLPGHHASGHMQLWIPAVNLANLAPTVPLAAKAVTTLNMQWPDGSSTLEPPPAVAQKGIEDPAGGNVQWGCAGVQ